MNAAKTRTSAMRLLGNRFSQFFAKQDECLPSVDLAHPLTSTKSFDERANRFGDHRPVVDQAGVPPRQGAKAMGALAKQGWRPQRTIVYTSWDGEEPMLLGSTEWAEAHASELKPRRDRVSDVGNL